MFPMVHHQASGSKDMPGCPVVGERPNTPLPNWRKATQRGRLLAGMVTAANRDGYAGANVSAVIREAGVSRPTFYDYFEDREDCFVETVVDIRERLLLGVSEAVEEAPAELALSVAVEAIVAFAGSQPAEARFLMKEALAGGPRALDARDRGIAQTAEAVEGVLGRAPKNAAIPDVPVAAVLGAIHRVLASRLRRGERALDELRQDLLRWIASYERRAAHQRWRKLEPRVARERSPHVPPTALGPPPTLGPGRPRLSEEEVAENHRQRIMFATSEIVRERGYAAATIAEITRLARVDGGVFYRLFADKQEAFSAIHELGLQDMMTAATEAFFAGRSWPDRIWETFRAATQSIDDNPTVAHVAFVEAYAVGPLGIQRLENSLSALTIFLQEGYSYQQNGDAPLPRVALDAIVNTIFEVVYLQARASKRPGAAGLVAQFAHLCLAPFIGTTASDEFIDGRLAEVRIARKGAGRTRRQKPRAHPERVM
jgi:AcrR family transcriptional regulator